MEQSILYVTWGETIVDSGIFKNQVLEQLKLIKNQRPKLNLFLLSGIPIGNKKLLKSPISFVGELKQIKAVCKENDIHFFWRWIPVPSPWFYTPPAKIKLYDLFQKGFIRRFLKKHLIQVVHCRSYTPTRLLLETRKEFPQLSFKLIFDTRGNFPEEGRLKTFFTERDYTWWKEKERQLFKESDVIVNVSDTFTDYVKTLTDNHDIYTIYTSANLSIFKREEEEERQVSRMNQNIRDFEKVLVYLGDLGENGWHDKANLFELYKSFKGVFGKTKLLLITRNLRTEFEGSFLRLFGDADELMVIKGENPQDVNRYLNIADYASLPFKKVTHTLDKILGYTMIASKTGEYLACGLPIITNSEIGAASKLIRQAGMGVVYETGNENAIKEPLLNIESNKEDITRKCIDISKKFDAKRNARMYLQIYDKLLKPSDLLSEISKLSP